VYYSMQDCIKDS